MQATTAGTATPPRMEDSSTKGRTKRLRTKNSKNMIRLTCRAYCVPLALAFVAQATQAFILLMPRRDDPDYRALWCNTARIARWMAWIWSCIAVSYLACCRAERGWQKHDSSRTDWPARGPMEEP